MILLVLVPRRLFDYYMEYVLIRTWSRLNVWSFVPNYLSSTSLCCVVAWRSNKLVVTRAAYSLSTQHQHRKKNLFPRELDVYLTAGHEILLYVGNSILFVTPESGRSVVFVEKSWGNGIIGIQISKSLTIMRLSDVDPWKSKRYTGYDFGSFRPVEYSPVLLAHVHSPLHFIAYILRWNSFAAESRPAWQ